MADNADNAPKGSQLKAPLDTATLDRAETDAQLMAASPALAAEVLRLRRVLAVEQGDQSQAPEGWAEESSPREHRPSWVRRVLLPTGGLDWLCQVWWAWNGWRWEANGLPIPRHQGVAKTALEAMEAADRALEVAP